MQTFRCNDEYLRHLSFLFLSLIHLCIAVTDSNLPLHSKTFNHFSHGPANIFGQCTKRSNPKQPEMIAGFRLIVFRILINELDEGSKKNRKSLSTSRRCIYESGTRLYNMAPGFFLEGKGL